MVDKSGDWNRIIFNLNFFARVVAVASGIYDLALGAVPGVLLRCAPDFSSVVPLAPRMEEGLD